MRSAKKPIAPYGVVPACGGFMVFVPEDEGDMCEVLDPTRDGEQIRRAIRVAAKRLGEGAAWVKEKQAELRVALPKRGARQQESSRPRERRPRA